MGVWEKDDCQDSAFEILVNRKKHITMLSEKSDSLIDVVMKLQTGRIVDRSKIAEA